MTFKTWRDVSFVIIPSIICILWLLSAVCMRWSWGELRVRDLWWFLIQALDTNTAVISRILTVNIQNLPRKWVEDGNYPVYFLKNKVSIIIVLFKLITWDALQRNQNNPLSQFATTSEWKIKRPVCNALWFKRILWNNFLLIESL